MDARGRAWISVGLATATLLFPLVQVLSARHGARSTATRPGLTMVMGLAFKWGFSARPPREPRRGILPALPRQALVALWVAPWAAVSGLVFAAPQIEAATGAAVQSILLMAVCAIVWRALTIDDLRLAGSGTTP